MSNPNNSGLGCFKGPKLFGLFYYFLKLKEKVMKIFVFYDILNKTRFYRRRILMKNWLRKLLTIVFAVIFLIAIGHIIHLMLDSRDAEQAASHAQSIAGVIPTTTDAPTTEPVPSTTETKPTETTPPETTEVTLPPDDNTSYLQQLDIRALQDVNREVIGWIYIPNTQVNYPIMHTVDNDTYLHTTWDGKDNVHGSIFLETRCSSKLKDFNTIIYGHNMLDGSMFAGLHLYRDYYYYQLHPYIYIATNDAIYRYAIFSSYEAGIRTDTYRLRFTSKEKEQALAHYINSSVWETELTPTTEDLILTLSTCTGRGTYESRWVVQAVLEGKWNK